jgi:hypothetical protein
MLDVARSVTALQRAGRSEELGDIFLTFLRAAKFQQIERSRLCKPILKQIQLLFWQGTHFPADAVIRGMALV